MMKFVWLVTAMLCSVLWTGFASASSVAPQAASSTALASGANA